MGFKRGWRAFKASHSTGPGTRREVEPMARRRRSSFKRRAVGFARKAKRYSGVGNSSALLQLDAMAYGALRPYVSNAIAPMTNKIPVPYGLSDEVGMGLVLWGITKYAKGGMLGKIAQKGLVIENARVGEALASGITGGSTTATQVFQYG